MAFTQDQYELIAQPPKKVEPSVIFQKQVEYWKDKGFSITFDAIEHLTPLIPSEGLFLLVPERPENLKLSNCVEMLNAVTTLKDNEIVDCHTPEKLRLLVAIDDGRGARNPNDMFRETLKLTKKNRIQFDLWAATAFASFWPQVFYHHDLVLPAVRCGSCPLTLWKDGEMLRFGSTGDSWRSDDVGIPSAHECIC